MQWLFSATDAFAICAIWSYNASSRTWNCFSPLLDGLEPICPATCFQDGVGYWIKANQACTLEISGVMGENGPFTPAEYPVYSSWNLMGFTSVNGLATSAYLESLATGSTSTALSAVGPVYVYDAQNHVWTRDPAMLWPGQGFWMNFKDTTDAKPPLSPVAYLSP
jgi:hypothetical protein